MTFWKTIILIVIAMIAFPIAIIIGILVGVGYFLCIWIEQVFKRVIEGV
jgi:hypothetical protein